MEGRMIIDKLSNSHLYESLSLRIRRALQYVRQTDLAATDVGRYEIDGSNLYAMVQQYSTKLREQGVWEAHRRYIDLQYVVQGTERIGYVHLSRLTKGEYDEAKDFWRLTGEGDFLTLSSGDFMILMPEDAHMPGMAVDAPSPVRKVIVKIAVQ
jgi:YhcH/YjgK/YiaL family protein